MDIDQAIRSRRSCREYDSRPIPEDLLHEIMDAAVMAPSAKNLQPWYFVVLTNPEDIELVGRIMGERSDVMRSELFARFARNPEVVEETMGFLRTFGGAPCMVLAFAYSRDYDPTWKPDVIQSVSAACENLILAAQGRGVGSCWLSALCRAAEGIEEEFAPENGYLIAGITLGYPKDGVALRAVKRKEGRVCYR